MAKLLLYLMLILVGGYATVTVGKAITDRYAAISASLEGKASSLTK